MHLVYLNVIFVKEQKLESTPSGVAFESKLKAAAQKLFSNLGIDDEVNVICISVLLF